MSVVAEAEQVYSVDVEMADGTRTTVRVHGANPGEAFRQARETPGVRRVGRVTVGDRGAVYDRPATPQRPQNSAPRPGVTGARGQGAPEAPLSAAHRGQLLGLSINGPRLVREARPTGGERPFAHLQPPPPRPEPLVPPKPVAARPAPLNPFAPVNAPVSTSASVSAASVSMQSATAATVPAQPATATGTAAATDREYRIVKSRRKDGMPYLLQRGTWGQHGAKRVFASTWEKGFETREKAEHHQAWAERMAAEIAEFNRDLAESEAE
jgi:hypothetical protein